MFPDLMTTIEQIRALLAAEAKVAFGTGYLNEPPAEHGIGAPGNQDENHFRAIGRREGSEAEARARAAAAVLGG